MTDALGELSHMAAKKVYIGLLAFEGHLILYCLLSCFFFVCHGAISLDVQEYSIYIYLPIFLISLYAEGRLGKLPVPIHFNFAEIYIYSKLIRMMKLLGFKRFGLIPSRMEAENVRRK